jgi:signal transduction histidine kinase/ActR/RegA family two-component response regulator
LSGSHQAISERALIVAPQGRDAVVASRILGESGLVAEICGDLRVLLREVRAGAGVAMLTDEVVRNADIKDIVDWITSQPSWSDFPFVLLTERGAGLERNPVAARQMQALGNVTFLERPFHATTMVSVVKTALRGRRRQYEARARLDALRESETHARRAETDLRRLTETLEGRVEERTGELAAANRQLVAQIEERERIESTLRQMQRLEAVGQLTSGVAHDFNNLLTVVLGNLDFIQRRISKIADTKLLQRLSYMRLAAKRGAKLTAQLLAFSRRQRLEPQPIDLNDALASMRDLLESTLGGSVQINAVLRPGLWPAFVDPTQIELGVLNLAINARDAMEVGGTVTIETGNSTVGPPEAPEEPPAGEYVVISVIDTGSGMTKEVKAKAFEPFFTTKEVGKGSGLGLSQVLGFAKQSGGGMRIETRVGEGTSVKVFIPRAAKHEVSEASRDWPRLTPHHRKGATILLVDDDSAVRDVTATVLRDLGYVVLEVGSGGAALELLDQQCSIDLALLDYAMPGMNGMDIARQVHSKYPTIPILFVTGFADTAALEHVGEARIIKKPFIGDELGQKVLSAITKHSQRIGANVVPLGR